MGSYWRFGSASLHHGFVRHSEGTYAEFEVPGFVQGSLPASINNKGQILSPMRTNAATFVVNPDLTSFALQVTGAMFPNSINEQGVIAGTVGTQSGNVFVNHGFVGVPAGTPAAGPTIRTASGVIAASAFGGMDATAPGSWIEIYGSNLAPTTREWQAADFTGSTAPTSLGGVSVSVNGEPAFVSYISPGQINAQVPSGVMPGAAAVTVTNGALTSASYRITANAIEPGLVSVAAEGSYAAALFPGFVTYALPSFVTTAVPTRAAKPGDTLSFFGIGFGPVTPAVPAGQVASGMHRLDGDLKVSVNDIPAQVTYAGPAPGTVGLYQFNVVVPAGAGAAGTDVCSVTFTLNGTPIAQTPASPSAPHLDIGCEPQ